MSRRFASFAAVPALSGLLAATGPLALPMGAAIAQEPAEVPPRIQAVAELEDAATTGERTANDGNVILSGIPEVPPEISMRLAPYQNTRSAGFAGWKEAGEGIYISTRFGSVTQIHRVDMPGGARHQLTFAGEPVRGASRRPERDELLYSMDEGGGEFFQLFLFDPSTGESRRLTDGSSRNSQTVWSRDGSRLAYSSTRRDGRSNDVWVIAADDTASARVILEAPDGTFWAAADWDAEGSRLLVANFISITNSSVHLLDPVTGEMRRLAGDPERPGTNLPLGFDAEGAGFFFITDREGEFNQLAYQSVADGRVEMVTGDIPWNVEGGAFSRDRDRAAFTVNEGGISRLYLLDPDTRRYRQVENVPMGVVGLGDFSPDGRQLALTLNTPSTPSDVFTLELGEGPLSYGEITRWTYSEVGGLNPETFVTPELIEYRTFDGRMIPAFYYAPPGPGPHPVIIRIHGGPESQSRPTFSSVFQSWIHEVGAAVLDPNVRGSSGYGREYVSLDDGMKREDSVRDIGALLDWIAERPELDEERVIVYGGSYGGYMVLASLMHYSDRLRAGVNIVGISDFITFLENTESYRRDLRRAEYGDERDPEMRAFFEQISPLRNAERITAPLFVIQGQNDPRVPVTESEQIVRQVRENGHDVWYMNALNEGHGFARRENQDLMRDLVVLFFETHLQGGEQGEQAPGSAPRAADADAPGASDADATVRAVADQMMFKALEWQPELATLLGLPMPLHHLIADNSLEAVAAQRAQADQWRERLSGVDADALRSPQNRVLLGVLRHQLESDAGARVCRQELWGVSQLGGWQVQYPRLVQQQPVGDAAARQAALARFGQLPRYIDTEIANLREGLRQGFVAPRVNVERVMEQVDNLLSPPPAESPFALLATRAVDDAEGGEEATEFARKVEALIAGEINPALQRYRDFLADEYMARAREDVGVNALPEGEACYAALVRNHTTLELSPREVHEIGLREMEGIHEEMRQIGRRLFGVDDVPEILERFRSDPELLFNTREEILEVAEAAVARARAAMPEWFGILPKAEVVIEPYPEFMEANAPLGQYRLPSDDGSRPGTYLINLHRPERQPRGLIEGIAFHETIPGHHLQIAIQQELEGVHMLARYLRASAFTEGWGLYTERLADEMGLYSSDLDRLGMLSLQAFRAARLVVDAGIHALGWDRQRALDYMAATTAETPETIAVEVDRYIITPGQATAYMIGMLEIRRLRDLAEERLGERFDIQAFHDRVLEDGGVTLPTLRAKIEAWVEAEAGA